jgi:hypothetical protein
MSLFEFIVSMISVLIALASERAAVQIITAGIVVTTLVYATFLRFLPGALSADLPLSA